MIPNLPLPCTLFSPPVPQLFLLLSPSSPALLPFHSIFSITSPHLSLLPNLLIPLPSSSFLIFLLSSPLIPFSFLPFFFAHFHLLLSSFHSLSSSLLTSPLPTPASLQSRVFVGGVYRADKWQMTIAWRGRR